jgi:hypothetical protein
MRGTIGEGVTILDSGAEAEALRRDEPWPRSAPAISESGATRGS